MARLAKNAGDEVHSSALPEAVENSLGNIIITTNPVVIVGVNRRINSGNYEHLDVFTSVALPVEHTFDLEELKESLHAAATEGFLIASQETGQRYEQIKSLRNTGRGETTPSE